MALVNEHFLKLPGSYLFAEIARKVKAYKISHRNVCTSWHSSQS